LFHGKKKNLGKGKRDFLVKKEKEGEKVLFVWRREKEGGRECRKKKGGGEGRGLGIVGMGKGGKEKGRTPYSP